MGKEWKWCLLDTDTDKLYKDWQQIDNKWYFFWSNGVMATGWFKSPYSGKWYYLHDKDGYMLTDTLVGNWIIDHEGVAREQVNTNSYLFEFIKRFEGCYTKAYYCPSGVLTIGIGCTSTKWTSKGTITIDQCKEAFNEDIKIFESGVDSIGLALKSYERDALISFAFNVGLNAFKSSTLLKDIKLGNRLNIERDFLMWNKDSKGNVLQGLVNRRKAESNLFLTGKYN